MTSLKPSDHDRIRAASGLLYDASRTIRILGHVSWPGSVRERFFAAGARELPEVTYAPFDTGPCLQALAEARRHIRAAPGDDPARAGSAVDAWLERQARTLETSARMLAACGTPDFLRHGGELYGLPLEPLRDQTATAHDLARRFDAVIDSLDHIDLGAPPEACHLAQGLAAVMESAVKERFGADAPEVQVVDELSANALAGPRRIRIRRSACFTDNDQRQLVQHEAFVHVATSLNGLAQPDLKILAAGHPGTTRTQEGLAVFAEFVTGCMDLDRMRRLADRVLAIQMAIEGADFLEVYAYFLERTHHEVQAYENTRRVFRGGVPSGGAPFTKDVVYLDGLLRVHNFLRAIVSGGRADCLRLLFCGKLDLEDIPVLAELSCAGLCRPPRFLPPWAADIRFLLCQLTYSAFLGEFDMEPIRRHTAELLAHAPRVPDARV